MVKLNLGCGSNGINGWINYDWGMLPLLRKLPFLLMVATKVGLIDKGYYSKWPKFKLVDMRNTWPLKNDTINFIYTSHVMEHFELWEQQHILEEAMRVLKKMGYIRIVVPDLEILIKQYSLGKANAFNTAFFGWYKDKGEKIKFRKFIRDHKWMHDRNSMTKLLEDVGFREVKMCQYQKGNVPDLNKLDLKEYMDHSLYIEARK